MGNLKETRNNLTDENIKWPQGNRIEIGSDVDFVYIMRKDGEFVMSSIGKRMIEDYHLNQERVVQTLQEEYDTFFAKLADIMKWGFSAKGKFELHIFDSDKLDSSVRIKSGNLPIVSLDPLMTKGVFSHKVSRGFYLAGKKDFGQVARPGDKTLSHQANEIANYVGTAPVNVAEDDIFSGGSVIASLSELLSQGINVKKIIPGIQIGKPRKLSEMGLEVDPVVEYQTTDGTDIFEKVDLGDPRDYLLGASGLVIQLPNGDYGRAPYILPFVSTNARANLPSNIEKEFALKVLQANFEFFNTVQDIVGMPLLLKHMDHNFIVLMHQVFGVDRNTEMSQITSWLMDNMDNFSKAIQIQGEFQEKLASLKLPENIIFLDVNGTLFSDDSIGGYIPEEDIEYFKQVVERIQTKSLSVGLCSDSPLTQLRKLAIKLGIQGPIFAENGNILFHSNQQVKLNELPDIEEYKQRISGVALDLGLIKQNDSVAPEFGGIQIKADNDEWAFGANRETSVTVFGPVQLINELGLYYKSNNSGFSIDCSPEYNFFAIHPGENYKLNKGRSLNTLSLFGYNIMMIGNSMSDWVDPENNVICAFVKDARITSDVIGKTRYISDKPVIKGVIDILEKFE